MWSCFFCIFFYGIVFRTLSSEINRSILSIILSGGVAGGMCEYTYGKFEGMLLEMDNWRKITPDLVAGMFWPKVENFGK